MKSILFFIILFFICPYNVYSQNEKEIDTIYKQEFKDFSLFLIRDDSNEDITFWETILIDKKTRSYESINLNSYKKDLIYIYQKSMAEGAFYHNNIVNSYKINDKLFIFYTAWGKAKLFVYNLVSKKSKDYLIGKYISSGTFGSLESDIDFHKYNDFFYFNFYGGLQGSKAESVGYYDLKEDKLHLYYFLDDPIKVNNEGKTFDSLKENQDFSHQIKHLLIEKNIIKDNTEIKYLFQLKVNYFSYIWYAQNNIYTIKLIRYDHNNNQWVIEGYNDINADLYKKNK